MYTDYWGLTEKPFELTPDPRYLYYSQEHEKALTRLFYTVQELKGAMLLTGLYGCGKTILSRVFINELMRSKYEIALITNPHLSANELLIEIIYQLGGGLHAQASKGDLLRVFNELIYANIDIGKETVVVIDEAQTIPDTETFEELRLLLNLQQNDRFLLTLILIGQTELRNRLNQLPQLKQRLLLDCHLNPLDESDAMHYLKHRLQIAGAKKKIFDDNAMKTICRLSSGIPRVINGIADMALFEAFSRGIKHIEETFIRDVGENSYMDQTKKV